MRTPHLNPNSSKHTDDRRPTVNRHHTAAQSPPSSRVPTSSLAPIRATSALSSHQSPICPAFSHRLQPFGPWLLHIASSYGFFIRAVYLSLSVSCCRNHGSHPVSLHLTIPALHPACLVYDIPRDRLFLTVGYLSHHGSNVDRLVSPYHTAILYRHAMPPCHHRTLLPTRP
jgi:hypothetical protein